MTEMFRVFFCLDARLRQLLPPSADQLVNIHVHQLKDEGESSSGLVVEHLGGGGRGRALIEKKSMEKVRDFGMRGSGFETHR